jgi:hypothetical protein
MEKIRFDKFNRLFLFLDNKKDNFHFILIFLLVYFLKFGKTYSATKDGNGTADG